MKRHLHTAAVVVVGLLLATAAHGGRGRGGAAYRGAAVGPRGGTATYGGYRASGAHGSYGGRYGSVHGPYGAAAAGGSRGGSYTTRGGTTITHGSHGGAYVGPGGTVAAGGASATRVTTPSGRTVTTGSRGGAATGPGGTVAGRTTAGAAVGPRGAVAGGSRTVAGATRFPTDAGLGRYTAGRGVAVGGAYHSTRYVSRSTLTTQAGYVRRGWAHTSCFTASWYRNYPGAWRPARWVGVAVWTVPTYAVLATWCALPAIPVYYDYGSTVVFRDEEVYVDGDQTGSVQRYAEQAIDLSGAGREAEPKETDQWQSLGVFAIVQGDEKSSNQVFQLAVNKAGLIRGNYYDALGDYVLPVTGKVDRKTQRAAWTIGKRKDTVYEAGIANLTTKETTMLVHFGKKKTEQWGLIRIEEPRNEE